MKHLHAMTVIALLSLQATSCGKKKSGSSAAEGPSYAGDIAIAGSISGLLPNSSIVLSLNDGSEQLTLSENGSFTFETLFTETDNYKIDIAGYLGIWEIPFINNCVVNESEGTIPAENLEISVECQGLLHFYANGGENVGRGLWKTDGTEEGTSLVNEINPNAGAFGVYGEFNPIVIANQLYFFADDGVNGVQLWTSDGTTDGTTIVVDSGFVSSTPMFPKFVRSEDAFYFVYDDGTHGRELWRTDGTAEGTKLVKDINSGAASSEANHLRVINNTLYFVADDGVNGSELWVSDGSEAGTKLVKNITTGVDSTSFIASICNLDGNAYFLDQTTLTIRGLWRSDGTDAGTVKVKDIEFTQGNSTIIGSSMLAFKNMLIFTAETDNEGFELWKSDGTEAGTVLLKDIRTGAESSNPAELTSIGDMIIFSATNANGVRTIWKTDGTEAGTVPVMSSDSNTEMTLSRVTLADNRIFFRTTQASSGGELWISDGTEAGTRIVKDINPGAESSNPDKLYFDGTYLYFRASTPEAGNELWRTDGTEEGTFLIKDINPGTQGSLI